MASQIASPLSFPRLETPANRRPRKSSHRKPNRANFAFGAAVATGVFLAGLAYWITTKDKGEQLSAPSSRTSATASPTNPIKEPRHNTIAAAIPQIKLHPKAMPSPSASETSLSTDDENPFLSERTPNTKDSWIDEIVLDRLAELGIQPASVCPDGVFLRRVYIDCLGTLPTMSEAQSFLDSEDPDKRAQLIEQVLARPEFADYAAMKWCDILRVKAEFPVNLWPNAAQAYHHWIRAALFENRPYDEFVRELLTSSGSNFRKPQVNFYRAVQDKSQKGLAQAFALTFLGQRVEEWPEEKWNGLSVFFSQVGYKPTGEWKEEIVFFDRRKGRVASAEPVTATYPDGTQVTIPPGQDPREVLVDWLFKEKNPLVAEAAANRIWSWLLGQGIVEPADDIRPNNPPSNPALLTYLGQELIDSGYDLKHLYRLILNSQIYQLSCIPESEDSQAGANFAYYHVRRMEAEVLIDAICQLTGTFESYSSIIPEPFTFLPDGQRAIALPDGSITSAFLEMFGRPPRDTGLESERNNNLTAAQALHLLNSNHIRNKLKTGPGLPKIARGEGEFWNPNAIENLYLAILSRRPTAEEKLAMMGRSEEEVAWALINTDEFLFRH